MIKHCLATAAIIGLMTSAALAQNSVSTTSETVTVQPAPIVAAPPPPPADYSETKTVRTIDANGVERDSTQSYRKTETYGSGNGMLTGDTSVQTSGSVTTTVPPQPATVATTTTRTTTTETAR
jgi:hypothetical protein